MLVSLKWSRVFPNGEPGIKLEVETGESAVVPVYIFNDLEDEGTITLKASMAKPKPRHTPKRIRQISRKQEEKLAESMGGERHYGSGNKAGYEGDVRVRGKYRIEAKLTMSRSRALTRAEISKIRSECGFGEVPVIAIQFRNPETMAVEEDWVCMPRSEWERLNAATDNQ